MSLPSEGMSLSMGEGMSYTMVVRAFPHSAYVLFHARNTRYRSHAPLLPLTNTCVTTVSVCAYHCHVVCLTTALYVSYTVVVMVALYSTYTVVCM
jgi:hypothetical protein